MGVLQKVKAIKFLQDADLGAIEPGTEISVSTEKAKRLIELGKAEHVKPVAEAKEK